MGIWVQKETYWEPPPTERQVLAEGQHNQVRHYNHTYLNLAPTFQLAIIPSLTPNHQTHIVTVSRDILDEHSRKPVTAGEMLGNYHALRSNGTGKVEATEKSSEFLKTLTSASRGRAAVGAMRPKSASAVPSAAYDYDMDQTGGGGGGVFDAEPALSRPVSASNSRPGSASIASVSNSNNDISASASVRRPRTAGSVGRAATGTGSKSILLPSMRDLSAHDKARILSKYR